jgi:membrane-bound metal-dependent hydrolase YbcI (DUF457 family)
LPVTPFHYPIAYLIYKLAGKLSLPGLIVGSVLPDAEIPIMFLLLGTQVPNRMILHSLLGAMTVGLVLAVAITVWIYPALASRIFPINKLKVKEKCSLSISVTSSCFLGILSHVLLDVTNHDYNPVFWPFLAMSETPSPITPLFGGALPASILVHTLMAILFVGFFLKKRENFWERLLVE